MRQQGATVINGPPAETEGDDEVEGSYSALVTPVAVRDTVIGALGVHDENEKRRWTEEELALIEAVAERVALAAENLRLLDETQRRAAHERLVGSIAEKMQRAADMETLMRVATEELNKVLSGSNTYVRMSPKGALSPSGGDGQSGRGDD